MFAMLRARANSERIDSGRSQQNRVEIIQVNDSLPQIEWIDAAIDRAAQRFDCVPSELTKIQTALGRVLAQGILADRDSPALDVSAMDGYAMRLSDLSCSGVPVSGVACAGKPPIELPVGRAIQIFTGAAVPFGADCVIQREQTIESPGSVQLTVAPDSIRPGQNIRRRGENIKSGQLVLAEGTQLTTATAGALATFGPAEILVRRKVRVSLLTSGDELIEPGGQVQPWQIRDSNSLTLQGWLSGLPWATIIGQQRFGDTLQSAIQAIKLAGRDCDAIILTGGVSAGDTDYIPKALMELGGEILFHRLPIRPGKPVLVGCWEGKLVVGLPGNPVSAAVVSRVIAQPLLQRLGGVLPPPMTQLSLSESDDKRLNLVWYRLIELNGGHGRLIDSRGSGDLVSLSRSQGFIEQPAGQSGLGPWRTWLW